MEKHYIPTCPVCRGDRVRYACTIASKFRAVACSDCGFLFLSPQPSDDVLREIYGADYFCGAGDASLASAIEDLKRRTARMYLSKLKEYGATRGRLIEIGCGDGYFLAEAEAAGYEVFGVEYSQHAALKARDRISRGTVVVGDYMDESLSGQRFDVCVLADVIEHLREPRAALLAIGEMLRPGGCIMIATPSLDSWSAKLMRTNWMEFKAEHLSYFRRRTLESLLWQTGYSNVRFEAGVKAVSLSYVAAHFERYPTGTWSRLVRFVSAVLPRSLCTKPFYISGSGMVAIGKREGIREKPLVSVIVPVFNEESTVGNILSALEQKVILDAEKEVIVVESNSTDGSRGIVRRFERNPCFRVIYEDRPSGKGAATRLGLKQARGNIVLIQDADLEYDLEDYDCLLEPLLKGREAVVLGARHGGAFWKMRQFKGAYGTSVVMNVAHWLFTTLINVCFGVRLKDPFTMYKVFYRDAVCGLEFSCRRFDFDWELLIQLVRKGYRPIEIPVNYRSRSYSEGKKVRFFLDPFTWLLTLVRLRFTGRPRLPLLTD